LASENLIKLRRNWLKRRERDFALITAHTKLDISIGGM
jgi:hypothetical protein